MHQDSAPKIVLNDDYLDLRSQTNKSNSLFSERKTNRTRSRTAYQKPIQNPKTSRRVVDLNNEGLQYEKELINCGLKKLATSYATASVYQRKNNVVNSRKTKSKAREKSINSPKTQQIAVVSQEKVQLRSQSEFSMPPKNPETKFRCASPISTPIIRSRRPLHLENANETIVNKYTMTKPEDVKQSRVIPPGKRSRSQSKTRSRSGDGRKILDPKLCEKYSVLKVPWQRSWTMPAFATKSPLGIKCDNFDYSDRQTYLYDEGTEIDSYYLAEPTISYKAFQKQCIMVLFFCGSVCGILLVSVLIWFIFGNDILTTLFKRKTRESVLTKSLKYLGGGLIYMITRFFEGLGYVLALPTQKVYQSNPEYYRWPLNAIQLDD